MRPCRRSSGCDRSIWVPRTTPCRVWAAVAAAVVALGFSVCGVAPGAAAASYPSELAPPAEESRPLKDQVAELREMVASMDEIKGAISEMDVLKSFGRSHINKDLTFAIQTMQDEIRTLRLEQHELARRLDNCVCNEKLGQASEEETAASSSSMAVWAEETDEEGSRDVVRVDVRDSDWLKEVFFGGKPWVIHCDDSQAGRVGSLPRVLKESAMQLKGLATYGVLDCWERTSSGKTLAHRFNFPKPPVAFAVANGDPPVVIDLDGVSKPWQLRRKVLPHLQVSVARINGPEEFKLFCSSRRACMMVSFKVATQLAYVLSLLTPLLEEKRGVRAVSVDTSVWKVKLPAALAATKPKRRQNQTSHADLVCITRSGNQSRRGAFFRAAGEALLSNESISAFLDQCDQGRRLVSIREPPHISLRPGDQPRVHRPASAPSPAAGARAPSPPSTATSSPSARWKRGVAGQKRERTPSSASYSSPASSSETTPRQGTRAVPRYSSSYSSASSAKDVVGSRAKLDDEPLFSAISDGGDDVAATVGDEEVEDEEAHVIDLDAM